MRPFRCLALFLSSALASLILSAAAIAASSPLSLDDQALVERASAYLQGLNAAEGRFIQTDASGRTSRGAFYLSRPGRIRFQYEPPSGLLVVADGRLVNVWDARLKSFNSYPLGLTPLHVFLAKTVRLDRGARIAAVERTSDGFSITARDARRPQDGSITLEFSDQPVRLKAWTIADARGQRTRVVLEGLRSAAGLDPKLFVLVNPRRAAERGESPRGPGV